MKKVFYTLFLSIAITSASWAATNNSTTCKSIPEDKPKSDETKPKIQAVFLLDATGSMGGLIETAKQKIWSIAGGLAQTEPAPDIEVGMIFYRDRRDQFITKTIPLGKDMDNLYEVLMSMTATGGGDAPESVNQALYEGITKIDWDDEANTYKVMFLVGDCPPHMDYQDDVKYPESCLLAKEKGIIINTIQMGNYGATTPIWKEIAQKTGGEFILTDMRVNNISVATPFDKEINEKQYKLDQTRIYYGKGREIAETKMIQSAKVSKGDIAINARRAEYNLSAAGKDAYYGSNELLFDICNNGKKLSDIKKEDLPSDLQKMSASELETYVKNKIEERSLLEKEIGALNKQRHEYINTEIKKLDQSTVEKSFDNVVFGTMQLQAKTKGIKIEGGAKR